MALIGDARISTTDQELDLQHDALRAAGCTRIFIDRCSGVTGDRPGLAEALAFLREGDVLAVWKLDRLGRSMRDLVRTVEDLDGRDVGLRFLTEELDTQTPGGRRIFHIFGALAQFERDLILERTAAGLAAARARGRTGGRRPVVTPEKLRRTRGCILMERAIERSISERLGRARHPVDANAIAAVIQAVGREVGFALEPDESQAIQLASTSGFSVIDGGAGTGKSTITLALMRVAEAHIRRGWAVTVHKAQGSAFARIIMPVAKSRMLDRLLVYTAITRARFTALLVGDEQLLREA